MKPTTKVHLWFFVSCLLAGGGAALVFATDSALLRALGACMMVLNGLYAIQWAMMFVRAEAE